MATTKEAELITAVLLYATRCTAEADQSALRAMGFGPREIEALERLNVADLYRFDALRAHCLRVDLNREVFWHVVEHIKQLGESQELQQTLIKGDAPQEMMQSLYGLSAKEYTRWRRLLTLEPAVGRPAEPEDEKAHALWDAWQARVNDDAIELLSGEDYLALKSATGVELRSIWQLTQRWAQFGNPEGRPRI
ncbi:MAG: DUF2857 domain-containing protein [Gammaproteobacteria bacterium]|jgi:hypothetical protein|nr:DUF2857 domain-containing protein [Gammaproteobacteria bacterium]